MKKPLFSGFLSVGEKEFDIIPRWERPTLNEKTAFQRFLVCRGERI